MIRTNEDLEGFLSKLERKYERAAEGTYVVSMGPGRPLVAMRLATPVLVLEVVIGEVPTAPAERLLVLYRRLLEYNAERLLHAAYGIQGQQIMLSAALELVSVDLNELEAVLADLDMALAEQVPVLRELV
ncbi:MAG TPA: CesT family type III secretion system chaperone [Polyangiaceae bacterium]|nr:CesT family type III secretion system chaperone [Polyangiaceae bacterium]